MGKWRLYRKIHKRFDHRIEDIPCESRHQAIYKLVDLAKEDANWKDFSIQKFLDGEWATDISAYIEAEDIIENGEEEIKCDFDPPCQSCQERTKNETMD